MNLTSKLSPRRYGPFKVVAVISPVAYQIELPPQWKIHNVFHASLLTAYKETEQHGPNFVEPPPDIIEGEPEWEVEQILAVRRFGRTKKLQYHIRWKGYSPSHDSWENTTDIHAPELIKEFYTRQPTAIRVIREPHLDDDIAQFLSTSPLSSVTPSPCPTPPPSQQIAATSPALSSSHLAQKMEQSSSGSTLQESTSTSSAPSSIEMEWTSKCSGQPSSPPPKIQTSNLSTMQSSSLPETTTQSLDINSSDSISASTLSKQKQKNQRNPQLPHMNQHPPRTSQKSITPPTSRHQQTTSPSTSLHSSTLQATQQMQTMKTTTATRPPAPAAATQGLTSTKANNKEQKRLACLKAFETLHKRWVTFTKKFKNITLAKTFRHTNTTQALYLFVVHKDLFKQATKELKATGRSLPSPLTSEHASVTCDPTFTTTLRQHLAKVRVEMNTLGGASCHDPAPIFHFPPPPQVFPTMPSPPVTQPAHAQQTPVQRQSPANIPLPPSPPPMDICPPSPPCPTLAHLMP